MLEPEIKKDELISDKMVRQFSILLFLLSIALIVYSISIKANPNAFLILFLLGILGIIYPNFNRPLFFLLFVLIKPIGHFLGHFLLVVIYYLVLTPLAIIFRLAGRDVLKIKRPQTQSYWETINQSSNKLVYLRQYQK